MSHGPSSMIHVALSVLSLSFASACAGGAEPRGTTPAPVPSQMTQAQAPEPIIIETDHNIDRESLNVVLDQGLGRFLSNVETEPARDHEQFVGFRVVRFFENDPRFASVDIHVGDIITRVNGHSIQRPEDAMTVWNELRVASELLVEYVREGERRETRFAIVN
ncbi:MAG: hypothetical protein IPK60_16615 [Sandaracinaceae bacterium]|jgi:S1-C subfamily serine protease|nr:hypothetical protein [Sandaracinaceae bacterium]